MIIIIISIGLSAWLQVMGFDLRKAGGIFADPGEYPFIVRIGEAVAIPSAAGRTSYSHLLYCTGVVVTARWTVTAAHCFTGMSNQTMIVIIHDDAQGKRVGTLVNEIIVHPNYKELIERFRNSFVHNDIGLVRHDKIALEAYAKLSSVDYSALFGTVCVVTGFGVAKGRKVNYPDNLLVLDGAVSSCGSMGFVFPNLCAARACEDPAESFCSGHSGGPLLHTSGVVAVNAVSEKNCLIFESKLVGVFTPLSPYLRWIRAHLNASNDED